MILTMISMPGDWLPRSMRTIMGCLMPVNSAGQAIAASSRRTINWPQWSAQVTRVTKGRRAMRILGLVEHHCHQRAATVIDATRLTPDRFIWTDVPSGTSITAVGCYGNGKRRAGGVIATPPLLTQLFTFASLLRKEIPRETLSSRPHRGHCRGARLRCRSDIAHLSCQSRQWCC